MCFYAFILSSFLSFLFLSNITPLLCKLHWLPIKYRIAPDYVCNLINRKISAKYELRSNQKLLLEGPGCKMLPTLGAKALSSFVPYV